MSATTRIANPPPISRRRLWFGAVASAVAWTLCESINVALAWEACRGGPAGTGVFTQTGMHVLLGVITFISLGVSIWAGVVSFRNWRALGEQAGEEDDFASAEARDRREFMGYVGVLVSIALTVGIIWFVLPIYFLGVCVRPH
jgi:hypothetical protein